MNNEKISIEISTGTIIKFLLLILLVLVLYFLRDVLAVLITSVVIASAIEPATRRITSYRIPRVLTVLFIYLAAISVIGFIFYLIIPPLISELMGFLSDLPHNIEIFEPSNFLSFIPQLPAGFNNILREAILNLQSSLGNGTGALNFALKIFGGAVSLILIIVISFYLAVEERGIENFLRVVTPKQYEEYALDLWNRSRRKIGWWLQGQLLLALVVGALVYIGLTALGIQYALLLAILSGILEIIPIFGPIIAAIPAIGVAFLQEPVMGLYALLLYFIVQQFENHLIFPLVMRKTTGIPPLLVILSLFIGGKLAGFFGLLLAVPVATVLMEFINDFARRKQIKF
ncbi:AI-2E family transporter [Candidatus Giovannonibacteria bacterium]|nr:AI-2E family transporter [Candidatus Giovannonibacteria bacterium]